MHILIATGTFPPDTSGPARYTKILSEELPKHGVNVSVVSFGAVKHLPRFIRHIVYTWKLFLATKKGTIMYAQDPISVGVPTLLVHFFTGAPYVLKIVGDYAWEQGMQRFGVTMLPDVFVSTRQKSFTVRVLQRLQLLVAKRARTIIVPSQYLKELVTMWGIPQNKIVVVYNAFDSSLPEQSKESLQQKYTIQSPSIISVGRFVPWKGFLRLLDAFVVLQKEFPKLVLRIVGEGPGKDSLLKKIQELGVNESVILTGPLSQVDVLEYLKASDVFVLNTGYEGLSHLLLEAMAVGTPIVTTSVGGNPELITNEVTGLLVPYNDVSALEKSIKSLLVDSVLAATIKKAAAEKVTYFNKQKMIKGVLNVFQNKDV